MRLPQVYINGVRFGIFSKPLEVSMPMIPKHEYTRSSFEISGTCTMKFSEELKERLNELR